MVSTEMIMQKHSTYELDALSQQLMPIYTQICLIYEVASIDARGTILQNLTAGLQRLAEHFPWIAGQVVRANGILRIEALKETPRLTVKDLTEDATLSFRKLSSEDFPARRLDEEVLCPMPTRAGEREEWPVFLVQANLVEGGLILSLQGQHNAVDMVGLTQVAGLYGKACRAEGFRDEELRVGNLDRRDVVRFFDDEWEPSPDLLARLTSKKATVLTPAAEPSPSSPCRWANGLFSAAALADLKVSAMANVPQGQYISTDDALSAFLFQSITRARLPDLDLAADAMMSRTVDLRKYLDVPSTYPGNLASKTYLTHSIHDLLEMPLGTLALELRHQINPSIAQDALALCTLRSRGEHVSAKRSVDVNISSWAKFTDVYDLDFGVGKPLGVRRPCFAPERSEGIVYLLPRGVEGEIVVMMCLRKGYWGGLDGLEGWGRWARIVG